MEGYPFKPCAEIELCLLTERLLPARASSHFHSEKSTAEPLLVRQTTGPAPLQESQSAVTSTSQRARVRTLDRGRRFGKLRLFNGSLGLLTPVKLQTFLQYVTHSMNYAGLRE